MAVPSNTRRRNREVEPPPYRGRGRRRERPFLRVDRWCAALPESAWTRIEVRAGSKGPLVIAAVACRVCAKLGTAVGPEERLFVTREWQSAGTDKHDDDLAHAGGAEVSRAELARVAKAEHRMEECLQRAKSAAGLADDPVRTWRGWHPHRTLSLLAVWFLVGATRRGKNPDTGVDGATGAELDREPVGGVVGVPRLRDGSSTNHALATAERTGTVLSLSAA